MPKFKVGEEVCPNCGSSNISKDYTSSHGWVCNDCKTYIHRVKEPPTAHTMLTELGFDYNTKFKRYDSSERYNEVAITLTKTGYNIFAGGYDSGIDINLPLHEALSQLMREQTYGEK